MSMDAKDALSAVMFQLVAALERYEGDMELLVRDWFEASIYTRVSDGMDAIQRYCASAPGVSVPAVALLIAHSELVHVLWRGGDVARVSGDHRACLQALRRACQGQIARERACRPRAQSPAWPAFPASRFR